MHPRRLRFPELDLSRISATSITVTCPLNAETTIEGQDSPSESPATEESDVVTYVQNYQRGRAHIPHRMDIAFVSVPVRDERIGPGPATGFVLHYLCRPRSTGPVSDRSEEQREALFSRMAPFDFAPFILVDAEFEFPPNTGRQSWFPLPSRVADEVLGGVTELTGIRGSHFAQEDDERPAYSFWLQLDEDDETHLRIQFSVGTPLSGKAVRDIYGTLSEAALGMVRPGAGAGQEPQ